MQTLHVLLNRMKAIRLLFLMVVAWQVLPASVSAFYNPSTGRWPSRDPITEMEIINSIDQILDEQIDVQSFMHGLTRAQVDRNLYGFVRNDPASKSDIRGLISFSSSCTPQQQKDITAAFNDYCKRISTCWFRKCLMRNYSYDIRKKCEANNLHVICHQTETFWNACQGTCGYTHWTRIVDGKSIIHLCPDGLSEGGGCGPLGCTIIHEMVHTAGAWGEHYPQKAEACLGCLPPLFPGGPPAEDADRAGRCCQ